MFQIDQAGNILDLLVNLYFCSQDALNRTVEPENTEKAHGNTGGQWFTTWQEYIESWTGFTIYRGHKSQQLKCKHGPLNIHRNYSWTIQVKIRRKSQVYEPLRPSLRARPHSANQRKNCKETLADVSKLMCAIVINMLSVNLIWLANHFSKTSQSTQATSKIASRSEKESFQLRRVERITYPQSTPLRHHQ